MPPCHEKNHWPGAFAGGFPSRKAHWRCSVPWTCATHCLKNGLIVVMIFLNDHVVSTLWVFYVASNRYICYRCQKLMSLPYPQFVFYIFSKKDVTTQHPQADQVPYAGLWPLGAALLRPVEGSAALAGPLIGSAPGVITRCFFTRKGRDFSEFWKTRFFLDR